jgi:ATP-dependent Lhr-like helicase
MIKKIKVTKEGNNKKILKTLKPYVAYWLEKNFKTLTLPQQYAIPLIKNGKNVLITAPTGSGKTLAAFCSIIDELFSLAEEKKLENKVYCIYISPLRALDNDIKRNLLIPLTEIPKIAKENFNVELEEIRVGIRTGDTLPSEKQKQLLKPPHILITTPESIAIILTTKKFKEKLKDVKWVIIDEIHELADSKRGVHLSLSLERLENFVGRKIQRIGMGATLEPLEEAAKFLVGMENGKPRECYIIDARFVKPIDIKVLIPTKDLVYSSAEEINKNLYELLDDLISKHKTTLVFTNTRSGAERVHFHLKQMFPSKYLDEVTGVHHSSVSRDIRFEVEEKLKRGELKAVICVAPDTEILTTSSWKEISQMKDNFKILALDPSDLQVKKTKFYNVNCRKWLGDGLFIKTKTGKELKCTPEHKLLTIKNGELNWICARDLKEGDFIGTIREVLLPKIPPPHYVDIVKDCFVSLPMSSLNYLKNKLYEYFENLKLASSKVGIPHSHLISSLNGCRKMKLEELKKICYAINDRDFIYSFVRGIGTRKVTVRLRNKVMSKEFLRFFGFFLAEGCFDKSQIRVTNKHKSLLEKYHKIIFKEFGLKKRIQKDKNGVYHFRYYSNFLRNILIKLGAPTGRKSHNIFIPNFIFRLPKDYISEFISGYFDGDGSLKIYNKRVSSASFCTTSAKMAKDLQKLLLCVGVMSVVREGKTKVHDKINGRKIKRKGIFYRVEVMGGEYLRKFASLINPFRSNLRKIKDVLNSKGSCNQDVIPNVGNILRELRRSLNLSTKFLEKRGVYVRRYERGKRNISRRKLLDLLNFYKKFGRGYYYHYLRKLALSNIFWDRVKEIKPIKLNRVYDIVDVRNFHNFVANCIFVQNSSTSLELGIDIGHITEVIQIGSPKSVSRLMQRIGRAGHSLKEVSEGRVICLDRDDLIECLVMVKKCYEYWLDKFTMPKNCLDVLAQHLLGMAIEKKWNVKEAFEVVRRAYPFSTLKFETFVRVLEYLAGKYHTLEDYKVYGKIWFDEKDMMFGRRGKYARVIYSLNVGTIPDEVKIKVKSLDGKFIGFIEEGFLERLTKGDIFVLGGKTYEFVKAKKSTAFVLPVKEKRPTIPSWFSEQLPLSFDLALEVARFRERIMKEIERKNKREVIEFLKKEYLANEDVARNVYDYLKLELEFLRKFKAKRLPSDKVILVENFIDEENNQNIVFHTLFGRRVNDALSRVFAYALMKKIERSVRVSISDNGFILTVPPEIIQERFYSLLEIKKISKENRIDPKELVKLVNTKNFEELLVKSLENTELIKRKFRHVANRSLMILRNYKGHEISVEKQQMSAERLIRIVKKIKGFPVLEETYREILQDFMDVENAKMIIEKIEKGEIKYEFLPLLDLPSPFAHNLFAISESDVVLMEDRKKLLLKLHEKIVKKLGIKQIYETKHRSRR